MLIDSYTLKARFYPIVILFFPIVVLGIFYSVEFEKIYLLLTSLGIAGALMYLFSQLGRDQGKKKEKELWAEWGGAPTTQLLRLSDDRIDRYTKRRYHDRMIDLCHLPTVPNIEMESKNQSESDEIYTAWTKFLISKTRDTNKFSLLFKDNTSYGFRRNLWGLKTHAVLLVLVLLSANYCFWGITSRSWNPMIFPPNFQYTSIALIVILCFWILVVTKSWIKTPAFSYAERLCEAIDSIN